MCAEFLVGKDRLLVTPERRLEDNIRADIQEIEHEGMYWTEEPERGLQ
jgi:hypothetical protein